jgi:hypothetical protein
MLCRADPTNSDDMLPDLHRFRHLINPSNARLQLLLLLLFLQPNSVGQEFRNSYSIFMLAIKKRLWKQGTCH